LIPSLVNCRLKQWYRDERGVFSLEASLVLPLVCTVVLVMIIGSVYMYQIIVVQYISQTTADRTAFIWDQHEHDFATGRITSTDEYGIYHSDMLFRFISKVVRIDDYTQKTTVNMDDNAISNEKTNDQKTGAARLIESKLKQAVQFLSSGTLSLKGEISYYPSYLLPSVEVALQQNVTPMYWSGQLLFPSPQFSAQSNVVSPTDFIRGIDLIRYYSTKLSHYTSSEKNEWKQKGGKAIKAFSS